MAVFGGYETVGQALSRVGLTAVWRAGKTGAAGPAAFAVKAVEPSVEVAGPEEVRRRARALFASASVQAKVAASGARHWAPVHEQGETPGGAFYVTDYYSQTVAGLIRGRAKLSGKSLLSLVSGVLEGLRELDSASSRPHGNLKPSNILILEAKEPGSGNVFLADPLSDSELDKTAGRTADLAAIGNMIFRLVCRRNFNPVGDWPVGDNPDWSALGKSAPAWRELCSILLSPSLASQGVALDDIAARLGEIGKAEATTRKPVIVAACVAALVVVIAVVVFLKLRGPAPADYKQYQVPFKDYRSWLRALAEEIDQKEISADLWNKDENLRGILETLKTSQADILKLNEYLSSDSVLYGQFRDVSEEGVPTRDFVKKVKAPEIWPGVQAVVKCSAEIRDKYERWDPEEAIRGNQAAYASRGVAWKAYADYLSGLKKPPFSGDPTAQIQKLVKLTDSLATIANCWDEMEKAKPKMAQTGDAILQQFPDFVNKSVRETAAPKPDLAVLADKLGKMAELARKIAKRIETDWATTDKEAFEESEAYKIFRGHNNVADGRIFELWPSELATGDYTLSDKANPYRDPKLDTAVERIGKLVDAGAKLTQFLSAEQGKILGYKQRLDTLATRIDESRKKPVSPKLKPALDAKKDADLKALAALEDEIATWKKPLETPLDPKGDPRTQFRRDRDELKAAIARVSDSQERAKFEGRLAQIEKEGNREKLLDLDWVFAYQGPMKAAFLRANADLADLRSEVTPKTATVRPAEADPRDELTRIRDGVVDSVKKVRDAGATAAVARFDEEIKSVPLPDSGVVWVTASETVRSEISDACKKGVATLEPIGDRARKALEALRPYLTDDNVTASGSPPIEAFWKSRRKELLDSLAEERLGDIAAWQKRLAVLDGEIPREGERVSPSSYLVSAADVFSKWRQETLAKELPVPETAALEGLDSAAAKVKETLATVDRQIRDLDAGSQKVKSLIDNAAPLKDVAAAYESLQQDDLVFDDFQDDLAKLRANVTNLAKLASVKNKESLVQSAKGDDAAVAFNAWRQLPASVAGWPEDVADAKVALEIAENLMGFVARGGAGSGWLPKADEGENRRREIVDGCRDYLARSLAIVVSAAPSERADGIDLLNRFVNPLKDSRLAGILSQDAASRENLDRADYDVRLYEFADWVRRLREAPTAPDDAEIEKRIKDFVTAGVPASVSKYPDVDTLRKALDEVINPKAAVTGKTKTWPAPDKWVRRPGPDASSITYSWNDGVHKHDLTFKRVNAGGRNVYICTTEMSVGVFADVLSGVDNWYDGLRKNWEVLESATWLGPKSWNLAKKGVGKYELGEYDKWWVVEPNVQKEWFKSSENKATANKDMPTLEHPMQYISPQAAVYLAGRMGFRVPTAAEWKAAWEDAGMPATGNLRDKAWKDLLTEFRDKSREAGNVDISGPDGGVFRPRRLPRSDNYFEDRNDGRAWFDEVGPGDNQFHNLVGNVAEFVYTDDNKQRFQVIGGSALSPPDLWDGGKDRPFWKPYDYEAREFSDVGFRLAFDAPPSISDNLLEAMGKNVKYLGPSAG